MNPPTDHSDSDADLHNAPPRATFYKYLPQNLAAEFSRRVLGWLYSFSLVILMLLTLAFVVVTPADVIIQTQGTSSLGVKLFIILGSSAFFLLASIVYYFTRLIKSRVLINSIPSKSLYLPLEKNDLPKKSTLYIMKTLRRCVGEVKPRAGPLENDSERFDYPGMAPPNYIQQRNIRLGYQQQYSNLPENCVFQDVINSIGLKIKVDGLFAGNFTIPKNYTFREVMLAIAEELDDEGLLDPEMAQVARHVISDYERFKFGPDLIKQDALVAFLANLERLMTRYINSTSADMRDNDTQSSSQRRSSYAHTYSVGSRPEGHVFTENSEIESRLTRSSFLDPFDYYDDAASLRRRSLSNSGFGLVSRITTRSRDNLRGSTGTGDNSRLEVPSRRRNSSWSVLRDRMSGSSRPSEGPGDE